MTTEKREPWMEPAMLKRNMRRLAQVLSIARRNVQVHEGQCAVCNNEGPTQCLTRIAMEARAQATQDAIETIRYSKEWT